MDIRTIVLVMPLLFACGGRADNTASDIAGASSADASATPAVVDLGPWDLPLNVVPPDRPGDSLQVTWNEEFGHLEVSAGEHFSLIITEGPGDVERLKADLGRDLLRTHEVLREEPGLLVYRSAFPDDPDLVFTHAYQVLGSGGRSFVVETHPQGRFNEADVEVMVRAVLPKEAA